MANLVASQNFYNPNDSKKLDETRNKKAMLKQWKILHISSGSDDLQSSLLEPIVISRSTGRVLSRQILPFRLSIFA